jgi:glycerophosphoryl diester phosphodiesterase
MSFEDQLKLLGFIPDVYSPHYSLVTPALVQQCHDKKMKLVPWTVNNIDDIRRLKEMGVDGIITDYPDLFSKL